MQNLEMTIKLDLSDGQEKFSYIGSVKEDQVKNLVEDFLRLQIGKGTDSSPSNESDQYEITISLDLSYDSFSSIHNCGNLSLRDGILVRFLQAWEPKE